MVLTHTPTAGADQAVLLLNLSEQLHEVVAGQPQYGPSLIALLADCTTARAAYKPIEGAPSIWELALHLNAQQTIVRQWITGSDTRLLPEQDWPLIFDYSDEAWQDTQKRLLVNYEALAREVAVLTPQDLNQKVRMRKNCNYGELISSHLQHVVFCTGQIALLKQARLQ